MKRLLAIALVVLGLAPICVRADVANVSTSGSFTTTGITGQVFMSGQATCGVVLAGSGAGMAITPQVSSDSLANIIAGTAVWVTASNVNSGSLTANGTYLGGIAAQGINAFRLNVTAISSGTETYTVTCSPASAGASLSGALPSGTNTIGGVFTNASTSSVGATAGVQAGLTGTAVAVKASAGTLFSAYCINTSTTLGAALQIFNVATGSVTLGTTVPTAQAWIPPGGAVGPGMGMTGITPTIGQAFSTAISVAATTTPFVGAGTGNTGTAASQITCFEDYI